MGWRFSGVGVVFGGVDVGASSDGCAFVVSKLEGVFGSTFVVLGCAFSGCVFVVSGRGRIVHCGVEHCVGGF